MWDFRGSNGRGPRIALGQANWGERTSPLSSPRQCCCLAVARRYFLLCSGFRSPFLSSDELFHSVFFTRDGHDRRQCRFGGARFLLLHLCQQRCNSPISQELGWSNLDSCFVGSGRNLEDVQRICAQLEQIVMDPNPLNTKNLCPDICECFLLGGPWR